MSRTALFRERGRTPAVPVLLTGDEHLAAELVRLCAAAGVTPQVCGTVEQALHWWRRADLVLVGLDLAVAVAGTRPPTGAAVWVVAPGPVESSDLRVALEIGVDGLVELPVQTQALIGLLGDLADEDGGTGAAIGVIGGSGGAGASVFAAAVAQTSARSAPALLMDLDPHGPGAGLLLGLPDESGVGWETLSRTGGRMAGHALRDSLPGSRGATILTWQGLPETVPDATVREALDAGVRGHRVVVVDLPRQLALSGDLSARLDLVVVLARPEVTGLASAGRTVLRLGCDRVGVVLRGPRGRTALVEEVAGAPVLARMRDQRGLRDAVDLGFGPLRRPRGPLGAAVDRVLSVVAEEQTR